MDRAAARGVRERNLLEDGVEPERDAALNFHCRPPLARRLTLERVRVARAVVKLLDLTA